MSQKMRKICPTCMGKKTIEGNCECDMEWRGTQNGDNWDECQCTPEQECPTCGGKGFIE